MINNKLIHVSDDTKKKLIEDFEKYLDGTVQGLDVAKVDTIISRAQAYPDRHLLDIMYQDGLKSAVKTVISYFALPIINFHQDFPMHDNFHLVLEFFQHWVSLSNFHVDTNEDIEYHVQRLKNCLGVSLLPDLDEILAESFLNKKDFVDLFKMLRRYPYLNDCAMMPTVFWLLLQIMDFPAFDFADTPRSRLYFATMLKSLTAFWPETIWNWGDFDYD